MSTRRPLLLGILNVTPDSFSDGGQYATRAAAVAQGLRLLDEGADWLDVGGESTRPGSKPVDAPTERARVLPVIEGVLEARPQARISIDTSKAEVARAALDVGARMVNDVTALAEPDMARLCAERGTSVILMHMRGRPETMQEDTDYQDVIAEICAWLVERVAAAVQAGVSPDRILVDPGLGFGKAMEDNPRLVAAVPQIAARTGCPVVIGASRKRFIGEITGVDLPIERVHGSIGAALAAVEAGAALLRVHDVAATWQALQVYEACRRRP